MINGAKKSDSSIVPAKLANKVERSASESVEGDDGTKRNAELQSTVRIQSREAVKQAQARIRGAVAERFLIDLKERLAKFALSLHPEKTRLLEFGRYAAERRAERGQGKPETFDLPGLTHYCTTRKDGTDFQLGRKTQRKRMKAKLREIKETLRRLRHTPIDEQGRWLGTMMTGYFAYFAVQTDTYLLSAFRYHTSIIWFRSLRRRSQRHRLTWERMIRLIKRFLPSLSVLHPWPNHRFHVKYSR